MMHYLKTFLVLGTLLGLGFVLFRTLLAPQMRAWMDYRLAAVIPIVAIGLYAPGLWFYYGAILAAMVVLPRNRMEAIALYICLALMLPLVSHDVLVGGSYLLRLEGSHVASLGLLAAFRFPGPGNRRVAGGALTAVVMLFLILQTIIDTRLVTTSFTTGLRAMATTVLALGIPYMLLSTATYRGADLRRPVACLVAVGFILSVVATFEMFRHWPLYQTIESHLGTSGGLSKTLSLRGGLLRSPGPFFESTTFGVFLAIATICAAAMRSLFRSPAAHLAAIALGCLGCFATLSRNAWIGVLLGLIVAGLYRGRVGKAASAGLLVMMAAGALIVAAPDSGMTASLLGKGKTSAADTATYRHDLLVKSIPLIRQSPLIGTPYDRVRDLMQAELTSGALKVDYVNSYLYYVVTTGVLGLIVFLVLIFYPIYTLFNLRRRLRDSPAEMEAAAALFAAQVALAFMVFGTSFFERIPLFAILLIGMTRLLVVRAAEGVQAPSTVARRAPQPKLLVIDPMHPTLRPGVR